MRILVSLFALLLLCNGGELLAQSVKPVLLKENGDFPNNPKCALLLYKNVMDNNEADMASALESLFNQHGWEPAWRNGIFSYHHYHSNTHEVLGIYSGSAEVMFGGPDGETLTVEAGDVVLIPAGVSHKNISSSGALGVVGAYPQGRSWDMNRGKAAERPEADKNIAAVPMPVQDPVLGKDGGLHKHW